MALAVGAEGETVEQPSAPATSNASTGPTGRLAHRPHRRRQGPRTRAGPRRVGGVPHSRWSMSRKPVFLARTPRLVSQVSAQRTTPTASSPAGDLVLHHVGLEPRPRTEEVAAADGTDDRQHRRCTEGALGGRVAAQDQARDVDDGEHGQQQEGGGARQRPDHRGLRVEGDHGDQAERQEGGEEDRGPRRATAREHLAEGARQHVLLGHAVDEPARHQHVDQGRVGDREHREEREDVSIGRSGAPILTTSSRIPASALVGSAIWPAGMTATTEIATSM